MTSKPTPIITTENTVTLISLGREFDNLDEKLLDEVKDIILDAANAADPPLIVLDLSNVSFFGSSFIEVLFRIWNRVNGQEGGKFGICGLTPYCKEVLEVTHLDRLWGIFETKAEALSAVSST